MRSKFKWIFTLLLALLLQFSYAQEKTISGVVSDNTGPLAGANVLVKGTLTRVQTDFDGSYSIKANTGDVLVFSFLGLLGKSVKVDFSPINVILEIDPKSLEGVVIVAYGKQKSKSIVGSVGTIGNEVFGKQTATSVLSSLQGSVGGVTIINSGGQPGDNPMIRIRGISSINASADPLIIVDGAPFTGDINSISADQLQSISVLKDASSTALYGSRGSNGVILLTTKRGKLNTAPKVKISSSLGLSSNAVGMHKLVDSDTFMKYSWEAARNTNQYINNQTAVDAGLNASNGLIASLGYNPYTVATPVDANGNLVTTDKKWNTDWAKLILKNAAVRTEHSLSVDGGSENTTYSFSANYMSQEGSVVNSNFNRTTTRLSVDSKIKDWLTFGITSFYATSSQNYPTQSGNNYDSVIKWIYLVPSIYPVYRRDENGDLVKDGKGANIFDYGNTSGQLLNGNRPMVNGENAYGALFNYKKQYKNDNFTANAYLLFTLAKDLTFKTNLNYEKHTYNDYEYGNSEVGQVASIGGTVTQNRDFTTSSNLINTLSYKKSFDNHTFAADLIQETYKFQLDKLGAAGQGFLPGVMVLSGSATPLYASGSIIDERISSYLGRLTYNFKEKYFAEGSYRKDGSTRFGSGRRWGSFYAVGGAWLVSEENFLKDNETINVLKLKTSYGELGNNRLDDYFPYKQMYNAGWSELNNSGVILGRATDPNLTWEKTASTNYGVEIGLFENRVFATIDYYNKKSVDLIYDKPIPRSTGNDVITTNVGELKNYGWEFSVNTRNIVNTDFLWTSNLNFTMGKNKISKLPQASFINGDKKWEVGRSLYEFYIPEWAGVDPATGYGMWYSDVLDDMGKPTGEKVTTKSYSDATKYYVGKSSLPKVVGGFTNYFKYKDIDLNILFNFSYGSYVYDNTYAELMSGLQVPGTAVSQDLQSRWQKPGDVTNVPLFLASNNNFSAVSTRFLFKNDYVRLKALNVGYNLPKSIVDKINFSKIRVYVQGDNLLTYQSHKGIDPEQDLDGSTDSRSYNQRIISFGANLEF